MIALKNQVGSLVGPLHTVDSQRYDDDELGGMLSDLETSLGLLDPGDLSSIKAILSKYVGRTGTVNRLGASVPSTDATDARSKCLAQISHTKMVAAGYKTFWDERNAELARSVTR